MATNKIVSLMSKSAEPLIRNHCERDGILIFRPSTRLGSASLIIVDLHSFLYPRDGIQLFFHSLWPHLVVLLFQKIET